MFFGNRTISIHLLRGILGVATLYASLHYVDSSVWVGIILLVVAILLLKGCPICWTLGLIETIVMTMHRRNERKFDSSKFAIPQLSLKALVLIPLSLASVAFAFENPVDRWANATGGRERVAAIKSIYREGTIEFGGLQVSLKVWHTAGGKYRKEEQGGDYSLIETFDGADGYVQQGKQAARKMTSAELELALSRRFANANAMFFAFFPERRRGTVTIENDNTIVLKPEGGVEWRVNLDPQTSLPKTMLHKEGERTITVTFDSYETIDGIKFEKEIHRSAGGPQTANIRFTKTVINPPLDTVRFSLTQ